MIYTNYITFLSIIQTKNRVWTTIKKLRYPSTSKHILKPWAWCIFSFAEANKRYGAQTEAVPLPLKANFR